LRLTSLVVYPIKSCGAVHLDSAVLERRGLRHDRRFMIVDPEGKFVTQREEPRLVEVAVSLEQEALRVSTPRAGVVVIEACPPASELGPSRTVTVWRDTLEVPEVPALSALLSAHLGRELACVYLPESVQRPVSPKHARPGDEVSFADGYPLLVASESSRLDLEQRAGVPLEMARFRPNVVVSGAPPWAEDRWSRLRVGEVRLRATKPCARCVVTTLDPRTGAADKEPLRTLARFRRVEGEVMFGVNLVPELAADQLAGGGPLLRLGDPVTCEERVGAA